MINQPRNTLVTGGLQGIGRAIVEYLVTQKDTVCVFDIYTKDTPEVQDFLLAYPEVSYFEVDISSVTSIKSGFDQLNSFYKTLDVLVNNAGITRDTMALRMSESDWDQVLDVNLKGAFFCSQQALKCMIKQKKSYIINISSVVGLYGNAGQANYAASKAGLIALTKSLAYEYGSRNILVNAIAPGFIQTRMTDRLSQEIQTVILDRIALKRFGSPDDVASLVGFLTSGAADYITGQVIELSGGLR